MTDAQNANRQVKISLLFVHRKRTGSDLDANKIALYSNSTKISGFKLVDAYFMNHITEHLKP